MKTGSSILIDLPPDIRILGIGTDIEETNRFQKHFHDKGEPDGLVFDVFTEREIRLNKLQKDPLKAFTAGFCCKEATFKALGRGWMNGPLTWTDIELLFHDPDDPNNFEVTLSPAARAFIQGEPEAKAAGRLAYRRDHVIFDIILYHLGHGG